tara:strand:+ start:2843 stop:3697 length:855 start_codon:yes stop_codon:yes gene_type:complete
MKVTKSDLKEMIIQCLNENITGAELYSKVLDKPLDPDYRRQLRKLTKSKEEKPEEKPKDTGPAGFKKMSRGEIQFALNKLGLTPERVKSSISDITKTMTNKEDIDVIKMVGKELANYFDKLPKSGRAQISEGYVITKNNPISIKEIVMNWTNGIQPAPNEHYDMMANLDDVLEYRDMSSRPLQLSTEEMESLKRDLKQTGLTDSVVIEIGKNGQAAVTGGNQMIELAKHLNIQEIPVSFVFKDHVQKANKVTAEPAEIKKAAEDQLEEPVYGQSMQGRGTSLDV